MNCDLELFVTKLYAKQIGTPVPLCKYLNDRASFYVVEHV